MIILFSPTKTMNQKKLTLASVLPTTTPLLYSHTLPILKKLSQMSVSELSTALGVSSALAELTQTRYQLISSGNQDQAGPSLGMYQGDGFRALDPQSLSSEELEYMAGHMLILSAYYGIVRPFDLISPYRLELISKVQINNQDLVDYWRTRVTNQLIHLIHEGKHQLVVNLASKQYADLIDRSKIETEIVDIEFRQEVSPGVHRNQSIHAKRARGLLARHLITNKATNFDQLLSFKLEGYRPIQVHTNFVVFAKKVYV